jgi:hypothetical protein
MSEQKGVFELLKDFSFQHSLTARYAKLLYALHLLAGLIVAIWQVFNGFQVSSDKTSRFVMVWRISHKQNQSICALRR